MASAVRPAPGDAPTKEAFLHQCMYCARESSGAVVHLHSTHAVAVSILDGLDPDDVLPPLTAYYVMRVGRLPMAPYFPPGDAALAEAVRDSGAKISVTSVEAKPSTRRPAASGGRTLRPARQGR